MLALPKLNGIVPAYQSAGTDPLAARCALALGKAMPLAPVGRTHGRPEHVALVKTIKAWMTEQCKGFQALDFSIQINLGYALPGHCKKQDEEALVTVFFGNDTGNAWRETWFLEPRWQALERMTPGLHETALHAIDHSLRHAVPLYTPRIALGLASHQFWMGEEDERIVLEEQGVTDDDIENGDFDILRRCDFDNAIPLYASTPAARLSRPKLERLARRRNDSAHFAALVCQLQDACRASSRASGPKYNFIADMEHQDEDGGSAIGFAAAIRWNKDDPMPTIFDDYGNYAAEISMTEHFGWFVLEPDDLPAWAASMERRLRVTRLLDQMIPLIAQKAR